MGAATISKYRFDVAVSDYLEYQRKLIAGTGLSLEGEKAKMAGVKRQITELHLAALQGTFVEQEAAAEIFRAVAMRLKSKLLSVVSRLARSCYQAGSIEQAHARAESYFGEVLDELSRLRISDLNKPKLQIFDARAKPAAEPQES